MKPSGHGPHSLRGSVAAERYFSRRVSELTLSSKDHGRVVNGRTKAELWLWAGYRRLHGRVVCMEAPRRHSRIVEGSCAQCRKLRVKCDLVRPACARCERTTRFCDYGPPLRFKWVGGSALRGRNAPVQPSHPKVVAEDAPLELCVGPRLESYSLEPEHMALYFTASVLPRFQLLDEMLHLDLAELMQDEPLKQAVVAISRAHLDLDCHVTSKDALVVRRSARLTAIHSLRRQLENGLDSIETAQKLFTVNVLLCMLDGMVEPSDEQPTASLWHLKGGYAMLEHWANMPLALIAGNGFSAHLLSIFATMDLVHAILSGNKPFCDALVWPMFAGVQAWWGRLQSGDRFLSLLKTFSEMAYLGHLVCSNLPQGIGIELAQRCLPSIEHALDSARTEPETISATLDLLTRNWRTFCRLYEVTGEIYVLRALKLHAMDDIAVQDAVHRGTALLVGDTALPGMMAHCIILPVLVLGAHALRVEDQNRVLRSLTPSILYLSFGSLTIMKEWLRETWRTAKIDANWWETFSSLSERVFLF